MLRVSRHVTAAGLFGSGARWYLAYTFLSGLAFGVFGLFYNLYVLSLGTSRSTLGALLAIPLLVVCSLALPAGALGRRLGYRRALLAGVAAYAAAIVGLAAFPTSLGLFGFALLLGVGQTLLDVCHAPLVAEISDERWRTRLFSTQFAVRLFASFFGSLVAGALPAAFAGAFRVGAESSAAYRGTLALSAALLAASVVPLARVRPPSPPIASSRSPHRGQRLPKRALARLFVPQAVIGIGAGAVVPFLNVFLKTRFTLSDGTLGVLFALQAIAMGTATLLGPRLASRLGRIRALVFTQIASIPFLAVLGFVPIYPVVVVAFLARAGLMNMGHPLYSAFAMEEVDARHRATASALLVMSSQGSRALSSWWSGLLQEGPGFGPAFGLTMACYLIASLLVLSFFGRRAHR
ncbi:MAG: MFS transporter [Candidatus Bipolaricaulota bacterium]